MHSPRFHEFRSVQSPQSVQALRSLRSPRSILSKHFLLAAALTIALLLALLPLAPVQAQSVAQAGPGDFNDEFVGGGVNRAVAADWLADGRVLLLEQTGRVVIINPANANVTPWFQLDDLDAEAENGSLDLAIGANDTVYIYYKAASDGRLRIGRFPFTGSGNDLNAQTVIWSNPGPLHSTWGGTNHIGGSLNIGPDNKLYLTIGDGFNAPNSQNLDSVFGKVLRINLDGSVPADNPFFDGAGPNIDEIWALGLRNPWKATFDDVTGRFWVGEVGGNDATTAYEEVNLVTAGSNYGWPLCEGPLTGPKSGPDCPANVTPPVHYYAHDFEDGCCFNASITGGPVIRGIAALEGDYVYADYARGDITLVELNGGTTRQGTTVLRDTDSFIPWIEQGPDGHLYYITFSYEGSFGELRRLRYTGEIGNRAPVVRSTTADPTTGEAPLSVSFSADVTDPEGAALTYSWDFGDGATSTRRAPTHVYDDTGAFTARLTVSDGQLTASSSAIPIRVGAAPTIRLRVPEGADDFEAGDSLRFTATARDSDGQIDKSSYRWSVLFDHDDHQHPVLSSDGRTAVVLDIPRVGHPFEGDTGFSISVTVTDSDGLSTTKTRQIKPKKINVDIASNLEGGLVAVDGIAHTTPFRIDTIPEFKHRLSVPATAVVDGKRTDFEAWTDTDDRFRIISATSGATYTAVLNSADVEREDDALVALYDFATNAEQQQTGTLDDSSGRGKPLALTVVKPSKVDFNDESVEFSGTAAVSAAKAKKVTTPISKSDAFTIETWIDPEGAKVGVSQLVALEKTQKSVTAGLGIQRFKSGQVRFTITTATKDTGRTGTTLKSSNVALNAGELNHVVVTRTPFGTVRLFVNGEVIDDWRVAGDILRANGHKLAVGARVSGSKPFTGEMHLTAVYAEALDTKTIRQNYKAGPNP